MQSFKKSFLVICLLALFCTIGSQSKKSSPPELVDIDLLGGDIIMCGGNQFGDVSFSLSCRFETREDFDLGISLLPSFENDEAEKAFLKVIDKDPDCTMAYWAIAMSRINPNWGPKREEFDDTRKLLKIAEALEAYELDLKPHPNRFNGIYGAAVTAKNLEKQQMAILYFEELLKLVEGVDSDSAEIEDATEFLRQKES